MTRHRPRGLRAGARRRGSQTVELILVLPLLLIVSLAIFQFGVLMVVHQAVSHAATVAAREAGKGATVQDLECVVNEVLSPHGITIGDRASVLLEDPQAAPPIESKGNLTCTAPATPPLDSGEVRVTVCVSTSCRPFINPLASLGFNLAGRTLSVSAVVKRT